MTTEQPPSALTSSAWEKLSDHDLIELWERWRPRYEEYNVDPAVDVEGFHQALKKRGWRCDLCPNCHHRRIRQDHDYICIICRKLEELDD